jgi:glycosyltransferase involved in cell wall biosynthesis
MRDTRLRLVRNDYNLGLFGNFNRCLQLSTGKYICLLGSDDQLAEGILARELPAMEEHPEVAMLSTRGQLTDVEGHPLRIIANHFPPGIYPGESAIFAWLWLYAHTRLNALNYPSGVLLLRDAALRAGPFREDMQSAGDIDFYLRMLQHGSLAISRNLGCRITLHGGQAHRALNMDGTAFREQLDVVCQHLDLLKSRGASRRMIEQTYGQALMVGLLRLLDRKTRCSGRLHIAIARRSPVPGYRLAAACVRCLTARAFWRYLPGMFLRLPPPEELGTR